jgi:arylsulfatase A-like enzyme
MAEPFLVPTRLAELVDETRPVARTVSADPSGSLEVRSPVFRVPAEARLEAWFGSVGATGVAWTFVLTAAAGVDSVERSARIAVGEAGWMDLSLDLAGLRDREVVVTLRAIPAGAPGEERAGPAAPQDERVDATAPGVLLGAPRLLLPRPSDRAGRNVILVSLDTLRADRLSVYGAERPTSPFMDRLAGEGVRFEHAMAPASSTPPSHMTMLTGTSPCRHGVFGVHLEDALPDAIDSLAEILGRDGYTTAAVTENAYVAAPYGFARGFDSYVELKQMEEDRNSPSPGVITPTGYAPRTFATADAWLRENAERRFFLFVHTYQVHGPRRPGAPYAELFAQEGEDRDGEDFDPEFHDLRRYDSLVRQLDDLVGTLVTRIEELGLADDTLLVLTSDHGEAFFEHDDHGHGWTVYEEVLRVPLIVWAPGLARPAVESTPVGLIDIAPTILELLALPLPAGIEGRSLAESIRGGATGRPAPRPYYAETAPGNVRAMRDGRFKIIRAETRETDVLFDLAADPAEQKPYALGRATLPDSLEEFSGEVARLRSDLDREAARCRQNRAAAESRRGGESARPDPARYEKLRALGYVE